jgi:hypothetical protein
MTMLSCTRIPPAQQSPTAARELYFSVMCSFLHWSLITLALRGLTSQHLKPNYSWFVCLICVLGF